MLLLDLAGLLGWLLAGGAGWAAWTQHRRAVVAEAERRALTDRARLAVTEAEASLRRVRDESERLRPFAAEPVLRDLLEVVDNLERALAAGEGGEGVAMIHRQSVELLRRHGAERIESLDRPFDPALHEAVATAPGAAPDRVVAEVCAGWRLNGRLLRAARVVVARIEEG